MTWVLSIGAVVWLSVMFGPWWVGAALGGIAVVTEGVIQCAKWMLRRRGKKMLDDAEGQVERILKAATRSEE